MRRRVPLPDAALQSDGFPLKMLGFMIFWILHTALTRCRGNSTVIRFSVPEDHHVSLKCSGFDGSDVVWTHEGRTILVSRQTNADPERYHLQPDGSLDLRRLDESDSGEYHCNQRQEAELQVLTGRDFRVSAGRTLLLPCRGSPRPKPKQKWFHRRRSEGKRELIFTCFRDGSMKPEKEGSRLSCGDEALHIRDLQLEDAGEYECNKNLLAGLTVLTGQPEPTRILHTSKTETPGVIVTDEKKGKRAENVLLMVAVVGLGLMILFLAAVCVLLTSMRCRRERKLSRTASQQHEDAELQPWDTSITQTDCGVRESLPLPEETIHYASLGRQNWRERPCRTPPDQNHHHVIYSSVITRPAAR